MIDRDRIEERNLSTQPYYRSDIGALKAKILANNLYRAIGTKVDAKTLELTSVNGANNSCWHSCCNHIDSTRPAS